jgi:hypothetical protein
MFSFILIKLDACCIGGRHGGALESKQEPLPLSQLHALSLCLFLARSGTAACGRKPVEKAK